MYQMDLAGQSPNEQRWDSLRFAMDRGDLLVVQYIVDRDGLAACKAIPVRDELSGWLSRARAHEDENGKGTFLVKENRFNAEMLPILDRIAVEGYVAYDDVPAPCWSMERGWHHG